MKSFTFRFYLATIAALCVFTSCVSTKKYDELAYEKRQLEFDRSQLKDTVEMQGRLISDLREKEDQLAVCRDRYDELLSDKKGLELARQDLQRQYDELLKQNNALVSTASEEKAELSGKLSMTQQELDRKERQLNDLQSDLEVREARLDELNAKLHAKDSAVSVLRQKIEDALLGFSDADLSIEKKNGKVYVSLSQNLLFAKGSNKLDPAGQDAIRKLAAVLKDNPDINITVEGHTDPDGTADRNWDLSVMRATTVVKELTDHEVDPERITASGKAFYDPLVQNTNEANKSKNRRTEIILSPRLGELLNILKI